MIGYAVIRHSQYAYGTMTTNEVEKVFETEEQAWECIERQYYKTKPNRIKSTRISIGQKGYIKGFYIYGESFTHEYRIYKTTIVFKPNKNLDEFINFDKPAYEKLLYVLCLLYRTSKDHDEKERLYGHINEVYDIMHKLEKGPEELHNTETMAKE